MKDSLDSPLVLSLLWSLIGGRCGGGLQMAGLRLPIKHAGQPQAQGRAVQLLCLLCPEDVAVCVCVCSLCRTAGV